MAEYSLEFSKMKGAAATQLKELIAGIKSGKIQMSGNEPKMSLRALRTLLLSEDKVHGDLVEKFLSGKLDVEEFKNKLRGAGETRIPKPLRRLPTDRIHHVTPLEIGNILQEMPDEELRKVLNEFEEQGYSFGDTDANVRGGSFDERAHTGARPKPSKSKIVYPNTVGEPGIREVSAHPRGTRDKLFDVSARPTTADDAVETIKPLLKQGADDFKLGVIADTPRREYINNQLVEKGVIEKGTDIFSANIDDATLKRAKPILQSDALQEAAAKVFKTPTILDAFRQIPGSRSFMAALPVVGAGFGALDIAERSAKAAETKDPVDTAQATLAGAGQIPVIGNAADLLNTGIDLWKAMSLRQKAKPMRHTILQKDVGRL